MDLELISNYYLDMFIQTFSDLEKNLLDLDTETKSKITKHKLNEIQKTYLETIDTLQKIDHDNGLSIFSSHMVQSKISDIDSLMCKIEVDIMDYEAIENQRTVTNLPIVPYKPIKLVPRFKLIEYLKGVVKNLTKIKELLSKPKIHKNMICDQQKKYIKIQKRYKVIMDTRGETTEYKNYIEEIDNLIIELDGLFEQLSWNYDICLRNLIDISKEVENIKKYMNDHNPDYGKLLEIAKKISELDTGYEIIRKNIVSNINDIDRDKYLGILMVSSNIDKLMRKVKNRILIFSEGKINLCSKTIENSTLLENNDKSQNKITAPPNINLPRAVHEITDTQPKIEITNQDHQRKMKDTCTLININEVDLELPILVSSMNKDIIDNQNLGNLEKLSKIEELLNKISSSRTHQKYKYLDILKKGFDIFVRNIDNIKTDKKIRNKICMLKKSFTDEIF